jgi:hypothetical protein
MDNNNDPPVNVPVRDKSFSSVHNCGSLIVILD